MFNTDTVAFGGFPAKRPLPGAHSSKRWTVNACPADRGGRSANMIALVEMPVSVRVFPLRLAPSEFITISDGTISVMAMPIVFCAGALIAS